MDKCCLRIEISDFKRSWEKKLIHNEISHLKLKIKNSMRGNKAQSAHRKPNKFCILNIMIFFACELKRILHIINRIALTTELRSGRSYQIFSFRFASLTSRKKSSTYFSI